MKLIQNLARGNFLTMKTQHFHQLKFYAQGFSIQYYISTNLLNSKKNC